MGDREATLRQARFNRSLFIGFTGETLTSDAGVALLREVDEAFRLTEDLSRRLIDPRVKGLVEHDLGELLRQRIYAIACGYPDALDAARLRRDPVHALAVTDHAEETLASQPTLCRLETEILSERRNLSALEGAHATWFSRLAARPEREDLIVDFDSTDDPVHGDQEGATWNGHFEEKCYHPLFAFSSRGWCLGGRLRPGNVPSAEGVEEFAEAIFRQVRGTAKRLRIRADSAFAWPGFLQILEDRGVQYVMRLATNPALEEIIERHTRHRPRRGRVKYVDLRWQAKSWLAPRRIVAKIEWKEGDLFPAVLFCVTNLDLSPRKVVRFYDGRGNVENYIKEGKETLRWDRLPCQAFEANAARLHLFVMAYNLLVAVRQRLLPPHEKHQALQTVREGLVKLGARLTSSGRRLYLRIAAAAPVRELFVRLLDRIAQLADSVTSRRLAPYPSRA